MSPKRRAQMVAILGLWLSAMPAVAQQPAQPPPIRLPELSVPGLLGQGYVAREATSAAKIDTPLIETPQSVSVITRDRLDAQGVRTLAEALRYTAGVEGESFGFEPRFTQLTIRGFDATTSGLFRDGLQLRNPAFAVSYNLEPFGVERIEILKGPASILYGATGPGGLVNLVSKRPTWEPRRVVELQAGSFDRFQGTFDLSGPIGAGGVLAYRLTGLLRDSDTQVDVIEDDRVFFAPALTWRPGPETTVTVLTHVQDDSTVSSQAYPAAGTLFANPHGRIPTNRFTGEPGVDKYNRTEYSIAYLLEHRATDALTLRQNARYYSTDFDQVVVFTSGLAADQRTLARLLFAGDGELDGVTVDTHAQIRFPTGPLGHTLLAGVDVQRVEVSARQAFGGAPGLDVFAPVYGAGVPPAPVFLDNETVEVQVGLYLHDQIKLGRWIVSGGGRYDWADAETRDRLARRRTDQKDRQFTGRAGILYAFEAGVSPYVSYAESFLPVAGTNAAGRPFEPETGRQYEVGVKYQPRGWNTTLTAAVFDLTRENVVQTDPATFLQVQTGEIRSRGLELEGVATLARSLNLLASYTYLDVEITETVVPAERGKRPTFPQSPRHMASVWGDYTFRGGVLDGFGFGAGVRYRGSTFGDAANTLEVPSVTLADAGLRYDWKSVRLGLNVHNISDEEYVAACFVRAVPLCSLGSRRTITGSIAYQW